MDSGSDEPWALLSVVDDSREAGFICGIGLFLSNTDAVHLGVGLLDMETKQNARPCCLTNRCRQRGMAVSVPLRGSRSLVPRA